MQFFLEAYNEKIKEIDERDRLISRLKKQLGKRAVRDVSSHAMISSAPAPSPSIGPIIEVPRTPKSPKFYTNEELEEEKSSFRATQVDVAIKFED